MTALPRVGARVSVTGTKDDATFTVTDWIKSWLEVHDELSFVFESGFAFNSKMWPGWEVSFEELEPPKPALPAEPPVWSTVTIEMPSVPDGVLIRRYPGGWSEPGRDLDEPGFRYRTWEWVCSLGTPVLLVPAPDLTELVAMLRGAAEIVHDDQHLSAFADCDNPWCVERRALLARYETGVAA